MVVHGFSTVGEMFKKKVVSLLSINIVYGTAIHTRGSMERFNYTVAVNKHNITNR